MTPERRKEIEWFSKQHTIFGTCGNACFACTLTECLEEIDRLRNNKEHLETGWSIQEKLRKARALLEEIADGKCGSDDARAYLDEAEK